MRMDAQPRTRLVKRDVAGRPSQGRRGGRQIVIALTRQEYDPMWRDPAAIRRRLLEQCECCPELFPEGFDPGFTLDGMLRESKKLPGVRLRKIVLHDDSIYERRPMSPNDCDPCPRSKEKQAGCAAQETSARTLI